uniref:S-adenosyl-L-methionine-dependent tRNA 4-demethylwyosine synthase TYW1 n=1 Tax=Scleropages formosus TaxID=113540 RepID=A0A8C9QP92_SCLFO
TGVSEEGWSSSDYLLWMWQSRWYGYCAGALLFALWLTVNTAREKKNAVQLANSTQHKIVKANGYLVEKEQKIYVSGVKIFFGSQTGTAKGFARNLAEDLHALDLIAEVIDLKDYDPEDSLSDECTSKAICVFLLATYTDGLPTENAEWFCKWLEEASTDFRYGQTYLKGMRYAVFGLGNSVYTGHYNTVSKNVDKWLWMLSAARILTRGEGDANVVKSRHGSLEADFGSWKARLLKRLEALVRGEKKACSGKCKKGTCKSKGKGKVLEQSEHHSSEEQLMETSSDAESATGEEADHRSVVDMEDLGNVMNLMRKAKRVPWCEPLGAFTQSLMAHVQLARLYRFSLLPFFFFLSSTGYKLIGSHSGVKLCRWTKSMLRGRGGCYKHTFYGIESHRCMEATPSLACANKCVFCWRHHTNPVGTEWRWKMDPPEIILQEALQNHQNMIKQFRGVPGVRPERFEEGLTAKHCALSLVGEPIMYPEINAFIRLLHRQRISSFLVTNAQFPEEIRSLVPVTQLYVSVDASTKDSLKKIDRPLFKDFWQRFLDSLKALGEKQQRTVYRLTLVKAWNVDELKAYADLISLGQPDFIEVKGVTYCGESSASNLTMANVPWHEEVVHFVRQLADLLPDYDIASEHEHSNCLLIAHRKFNVEGQWWTWIDYERFQEFAQLYEESGGQRTFSAEDYMARTPDWALFGAKERGFDPADTRFQRKNKTKDISGC